MAEPLNDQALDVIFREARPHVAWLPRPVEDDVLHRLYELAKFGPTSANTTPMRVVFVKSTEAKERLKPALMPGNVDKTMAAPVCAIVAHDTPTSMSRISSRRTRASPISSPPPAGKSSPGPT